MNEGMAFSVGFRVLDREWVTDPATDNEYRIIKEGDLMEVSIVTFGMNEECGTTIIKSSAHPNGEDDLENQDLAYDEKSLSVPPTTVAEFEHALIAAGFAKSRGRAKKMTTFVKSCVALFAKQGAEAVATPVVALDSLKFGATSDLIAKMKKTLSP
jgi:hypothetical protein